ncbi:helix-turn-helix domain-containing protein [Adlercreutzia sp.]|uniref:helix-turn-helix domain-containing protein n=1 Tax=Adlercreutzia sp. TaxID=1872387 RepID=UPI003A9457F2
MSIGENIRRLREREGLSQTAFAGRLGVTKETVRRGKRPHLPPAHPSGQDDRRLRRLR